MKFFSLYGRYRTYVGKKSVQFEKNQFATDDIEIIKALKLDKNVTIPPGQVDPSLVAEPVSADAPVVKPAAKAPKSADK